MEFACPFQIKIQFPKKKKSEMRLRRCQSWLREPYVTGPMFFIGKHICVSSTFKLRDSPSVNEKSERLHVRGYKAGSKNPSLGDSTFNSSVSCNLEGATALPGLCLWHEGFETMAYSCRVDWKRWPMSKTFKAYFNFLALMFSFYKRGLRSAERGI